MDITYKRVLDKDKLKSFLKSIIGVEVIVSSFLIAGVVYDKLLLLFISGVIFTISIEIPFYLSIKKIPNEVLA